jgi:glutamine---fructose-6-phosphate transaminase (isomerizing)
MCGIFGYYFVDKKSNLQDTLNCVVKGLEILEYRGYDSAGVGFFNKDNNIKIMKKKGNVKYLKENIRTEFENTCNIRDWNCIIGHTRWATHGIISEVNAHPQTSNSRNEFILVHNGIITNYLKLRKMMYSEHKNMIMTSQTDTEIIVKLFQHYYDKYPTESFINLTKRVCHDLEGAYAFMVISSNFPQQIICCRKGSPLNVGIRKKHHYSSSIEYFISSDNRPIHEHTDNIILLHDDDIMYIKKDNYQIFNTRILKQMDRTITQVHVDTEKNSMGIYSTFMEKEINEQPSIIHNTLNKRIKSYIEFPEINKQVILKSKRIILIACGTSYHSCLIGQFIMEKSFDKIITAEISSNFVDRQYYIDNEDVAIFLSQSGETADTLYALRLCKEKGAYCIAITNYKESTISKECDCSIDLKAGYEVSVASTKAYTTQIMTLNLLTAYIASKNIYEILQYYERLGVQMKTQIDLYAKTLPLITKEIDHYSSVLFIGRGIDYGTALEGALKMKEIAYVHCEGILAGELKHGPLALIDKNILNIVFVIKNDMYEKMTSVLEQLNARGSKMIVVCNDDDEQVKALVPMDSHIIEVPRTHEYLQPILNIIPMQLLAYYLAQQKGYNVDKPRNLAKSVTVTD